jgi:ATP-dependent helicase/nuclease subunit B
LKSPKNIFLEDVIQQLLTEHEHDLSQQIMVLPGKRPMVFIKEILKKKKYQGFLPKFITIEDLMQDIAQKQAISGIPLALFAYKTNQSLNGESLKSFLKYFPTIMKDWDDMMKFSDDDQKVLDYMLDEERIKNWAQDLGDPEDSLLQRNLDFWLKLRNFLPQLKQALLDKSWASTGMMHQLVRHRAADFAQETNKKYVFCGFNAFTPVEQLLVKALLKYGKAQTFFQADAYYMNNVLQESGQFLRRCKLWPEFDKTRPFGQIYDHFAQPKNIKLYEASNNIAQVKHLGQILRDWLVDLSPEDRQQKISETAVVLLDENLLPTMLHEVAQEVESLNITMGFPLKNLVYSGVFQRLFYLQKNFHQSKNKGIYHADVVAILNDLILSPEEQMVVQDFMAIINKKNMVYVPAKTIAQHLGQCAFFPVLQMYHDVEKYLDVLLDFCQTEKRKTKNSIHIENIALFQKAFVCLKNLCEQYPDVIQVENIELLSQQLLQKESIDFEGEPLMGLQIMGLLETRLLNFPNVILLSCNEGKLPLGKTQNTYIPYDVRKQFGMNTFLENDGIYAYHFYRLLQSAENVAIFYNAQSSGLNVGEQSRFITQLQMESPHEIEKIILDTPAQPSIESLMSIPKTPSVLAALELWQQKISPSHLISYLHDPCDFYLKKVLKIYEESELEEDLSSMMFGNLVHHALEQIYETLVGQIVAAEVLQLAIKNIDNELKKAIERLDLQADYFATGLNYVQYQMAKTSITEVLMHDIQLIQAGNELQMVAVEAEISSTFVLDENRKTEVGFYGKIDRIDRVNGKLRIIDYKSNVPSTAKLNLAEKFAEPDKKAKFILQLGFYALCWFAQHPQYQTEALQVGLWSFKKAKHGIQFAQVSKDESDVQFDDLENVSSLLRQIIQEILNPEINFQEPEPEDYRA